MSSLIHLTRCSYLEAANLFNNLVYAAGDVDGYSYEITDSEGRIYSLDICANEITRRSADTGFDPVIIAEINDQLKRNGVVELVSKGAVRYHLPIEDGLIDGGLAALQSKLAMGPIPFKAGNVNYVLTTIGVVLGIYSFRSHTSEIRHFIIAETDDRPYMEHCHNPAAAVVGTFMQSNVIDIDSIGLVEYMGPGHFRTNKQPFKIDWI